MASSGVEYLTMTEFLCSYLPISRSVSFTPHERFTTLKELEEHVKDGQTHYVAIVETDEKGRVRIAEVNFKDISFKNEEDLELFLAAMNEK